MKKRLIWNDIRENKLLYFSTWVFMSLCALLIALTCFLFTNLTGAIDVLMEKAQTPDYLQMHAGEIDEEALIRFAENQENVREFQVLRFLNLENANLTLGEHSLADSTQDNGVCIQSEKFDYFVDMDNEIINVQRGTIYIPVCYKLEYGLEVGETAQLGDETLKIAGFLRDSQMTSMMSSSKRFLVHEADYNRLSRDGNEEYLIEFLLAQGADTNKFASAYSDAGLPQNGPAVTKPLIRLMNALSDGMMALVIFLVSVVMLLISILCIRFTLLSRLEADRSEIGMLKAVGLSHRDIRKIYFDKYFVISALGAVSGLIAAAIIKEPLEKGLRELYGLGKGSLVSVLVPLFGAVLAELLILFSIGKTLGRTQRLSAVEALCGRDTEVKKPLILPQYKLIVFVIMLSVFLMVVPQNLHSTISSPDFVSYMGIGNADVRLDIRQTENMAAKTDEVVKLLSKDSRVEKSTSLITKSYQMVMADDTRTNMNVELGDHAAFPVAYAEGRAPKEKNELAISYLFADDLKLKLGDVVKTEIDGVLKELTICGIYSDITNGGKTAKAAWTDDHAPVMWSVFYISLIDGEEKASWIEHCEQMLKNMGINAKIVDITDFVEGTYGTTLRQIRLASYIAKISAMLVMLVVVLLFTRLLVEKDRYEISLRKAIGFTGREVKIRYKGKMLIIGIMGIVFGIILGNIIGQLLAGMMLRSMGATEFRFLVNAGAVYLIIPVLAFLSIAAAVALGLMKIENIKAYECCIGKE